MPVPATLFFSDHAEIFPAIFPFPRRDFSHHARIFPFIYPPHSMNQENPRKNILLTTEGILRHI
jgi:hypothetical protein